jgi:hypothetical protein
MTGENLELAIREGIPFMISMADGKEYVVKSSFDIALTRNCAFVVGDDQLPHMLPMLTMTGISYLKAA